MRSERPITIGQPTRCRRPSHLEFAPVGLQEVVVHAAHVSTGSWVADGNLARDVGMAKSARGCRVPRFWKTTGLSPLIYHVVNWFSKLI